MINSRFEDLLSTVKKLRDPKNGCPWDLKQNISSLAPSLLEECCECLDGISVGDYDNVKEELGDVLFTTTLMSYILEQDGVTTTDEIIENVNQKMIRRHPHIFSDTTGINSSEKVLEQWEDIKVKVEGRTQKGLLDRIPRSLPPLNKAYEIQKKVEQVGFDWENIEHIFDKIVEETIEVREEIKSKNTDKLEMEIGDLLFSVVNLSRYLKIDPSNALRRTNRKFENRFQYIEKKMSENNLELSKDNFKIMDGYWDESKKN